MIPQRPPHARADMLILPKGIDLSKCAGVVPIDGRESDHELINRQTDGYDPNVDYEH